MATAFILAVSTLTAAVPFILSQDAAAAPVGGTKQVFTSLSGSGWEFYNDVSVFSPVAGSFAIDPAYVAGAENNGAIRINAGAGQKHNLSTTSLNNTKLSDITAIGYDTYVTNTGSSYINIDVNFGDSSYKNYNGRLIYVPATTVNTWNHTENAVEGLWTWSRYSTNGSKWIDGVTTEARSWGDIVSAFPNAKVRTINYLDLGFTKLPVETTGYIHLRADQKDTYFDNVYVQKNNAAYTIYDFELNAAPIPTGLTSTSQSAEDITDGATKVNFVRNSWASVSDAVSYDYEFKKPNSLPTYSQSVTGTSVEGKFHNSASPEGEYAFRVRTVLANGLVSDWSNWSTVKYDKSAPKVSNISIDRTINGNIGGNVVVTFDLNDVAGVDLSKTYVLFADGPNTTNQKKESAKFTPVHVSGSTYMVTIDTLQFLKANWTGNYNLQFTMQDVLGNRTSTKPLNVLIDNDGPRSTLTAPTDGSYVRGTTKFAFDVVDVTGVKSGWVAFMKNGTEERRFILSEEVEGKWYANVDTTLLSDGTYTLDARFVDMFDKAAYGANKGTVIVDNEVPVTSITNATVLGDAISIEGSVSDTNLRHYYCYLTTNQTITVDGHTFTPGQEVYLNDDPINGSSRNGGCITGWANGQNSFSGVLGGFNIPNVPDGSYTVNLVAYDLAGNNNAANPATYTFTLDRTAPAVAITSVTTGLISGTADLDATIVLTIDGVDTAPFTPEADGTWEYVVDPAFGEGTHTVVATAYDAVGNERIDTMSFTVLAPVVEGEEPEVVIESQDITFPDAFNPGPADVQGDSTDNGAAVEGDSTEKTPAQAVNSDANQGKLMGLAWYWWLLIIAAAATAAWWIIAAIRRRNADA